MDKIDKMNQVILLKSNEFYVNRNNSLIIPKSPTKIFLEIRNSNSFYLHLSSKYVSQADGLIIDEKLDDLNYYFNDGVMRFTYDNINYEIYIKSDKRKNKLPIIFNILEKYKKNKSIYWDVPLMDSLPITTQNHYGTLILFRMPLLKKMKPGNKYYMVHGNQWHNDFNGKYHIMIYEYPGGKNLIDEYDYLKGRECVYNNKMGKFTWTKSYIRDSNDEFVEYGGDDPVHLVYEWNPDFRIPKISCAKGALVGKDFLTDNELKTYLLTAE